MIPLPAFGRNIDCLTHLDRVFRVSDRRAQQREERLLGHSAWSALGRAAGAQRTCGGGGQQPLRPTVLVVGGLG